MKPEQFIREYGTNTFRISMSFVNNAKYLVVHEGEVDFTDEIKPHHGDRVFERSVVKRLVESVDLVESYGGIESCKQSLYMLHELTEDPEPIREAVRDHESIYGDGDE